MVVRTTGHEDVSMTIEHDEMRRRLDHQIAFYEADAEPYERWLESLADDGNGSTVAAAAKERNRELAAWFGAHAPLGDVLEIAAGTGRISKLLAPHASALMLLDSSPTSLALARKNLQRGPSEVAAVCADIFEWRSPRQFDTIVFAAWLHHVPDAMFDHFWQVVATATAPDGRVMFDFALDTSTAHVASPPAKPAEDYAVFHDPARRLSVRDLHGQRWVVTHETWNTKTLGDRLASLGWQVSPSGPVDESFKWAVAERRP